MSSLNLHHDNLYMKQGVNHYISFTFFVYTNYNGWFSCWVMKYIKLFYVVSTRVTQLWSPSKTSLSYATGLSHMTLLSCASFSCVCKQSTLIYYTIVFSRRHWDTIFTCLYNLTHKCTLILYRKTGGWNHR